jgi:hypothetical protein
MASKELNGAVSPANWARKIAGPLMVRMSFLLIGRLAPHSKAFFAKQAASDRRLRNIR